MQEPSHEPSRRLHTEEPLLASASRIIFVGPEGVKPSVAGITQQTIVICTVRLSKNCLVCLWRKTSKQKTESALRLCRHGFLP